jgi:glycosyltransferase involved in cell wall biosynthesis
VPSVLFVGKQFERKGGPLLLEAFRLVRARFADARLVIIGPPTPPADGPGVEWLGNLDKNRPDQWARLVGAYQNADVFCLPSLFEPFGIVILEAMFFGLPCVGTAEWAIPEMIANGETGYTAPRDDVKALAERLIALLSDRASAHRMGLAGRRRAEERFSWTTVAARMGEGLQRCLPSPRR